MIRAGLYFAALLLLAACAGSSNQNSTGDPATDSLADQSDIPPYDYTQHYTGALDGRHAFHMTLHHEAGRIHGSYQYEGQSRSLRLEGRETEGQLEMKEYDPAGNHTGTFKGQVDPHTGFIGEWTKVGATNSLRVAAQLVNTRWYSRSDWLKDGVLEVKSETLALYSPDSLCSATRQYPVFSGFTDDALALRLNDYYRPKSVDTLAAELRACETETAEFASSTGMRSTQEESYSINYPGPEIISISSHYYAYHAGAAHGNYGSATANFDPATGKLFRNSDLFQPGFEAVLDELIRARIEAEYGDEGIEFGGIDSLQNLEIFPDRLEIYFNPYEIGAYALGQIRFDFDYAELMGIIRKDGPLAKFPLH